MTWFEALIIYLAAGAPFGVHHFFAIRGEKMLTRIATSLLHFVLWVPFASIAAVEHFRPHTVVEKLQKEIATLQLDIEKADIGSVSIFEMRRVIERYVGLRFLTHSSITNSEKDDLTIFTLACHPNPELAITCLNRRNRQRIICHQTDAARDLALLTTKLSAESSEPLKVTGIISRIALLLDDSRTITELQRPANVKGKEESEATPWTEIPKPPTNSQATTDLPTR